MTHVITLASPRAGFPVQSSAPSTTQPKAFDVFAPQLHTLVSPSAQLAGICTTAALNRRA